MRSWWRGSIPGPSSATVISRCAPRGCDETWMFGDRGDVRRDGDGDDQRGQRQRTARLRSRRARVGRASIPKRIGQVSRDLKRRCPLSFSVR